MGENTNPELIISTAKPTQPVDHKDTKAEAGNAEKGNPSCGDAIGSLVPSASRHQSHFFLSAKLPPQVDFFLTPQVLPEQILNQPHFTPGERSKKKGEGDFRGRWRCPCPRNLKHTAFVVLSFNGKLS